MEIITKNHQETQKIGKKLGQTALKRKEMFFLALEGNLGSGKTTFLQGFAKGLKVEDDITSPTFVIFKKYKGEEKKNFYHFDAYRIKSSDLEVLGFKEILKNKNSVIAVEWSENIKEALPKKMVTVKLFVVDENKRRLIVNDNNDIIESNLFSK